jgi:hypothetical protein
MPHENFLKFFSRALSRRKGWLYSQLLQRGYTPSQFSSLTNLDLSTLSHVNQNAWSGSVKFWRRVFLGLNMKGKTK